MTYDGWWDLNHPEESTSYSSSYSSPVAKKEEFQPIPVRYGKQNWTIAKRGEGTDILVQVGDQGITAHKVMLMAHSSFFRTMFTSQFQVGQPLEAVVKLENMDPAVFRCLLRFIYTGTLSKKDQLAYVKDPALLVALLGTSEYLGVEGMGI